MSKLLKANALLARVAKELNHYYYETGADEDHPLVTEINTFLDKK